MPRTTARIVPKGLGLMPSDPDAACPQRILQAILQMNKIELGGLKPAYADEQ